MELRLGVIGVGGLGYLQLEIYDEIPSVEVVAAVDVSAEAREVVQSEFDVSVYHDHRRMIQEHQEELDAVTIVTPHAYHYEQAKACLERGINVLVEKPMVTDVGHALLLCDLAERNDLVLQVGYQRHFHPAFREIRRVIDEGRIGDVHMVSCHLGQDWIRPHRNTWRMDAEISGGGQLYDTGSHLLDALLWTTESDPRSVAAQIEYYEPRIDVNSALSIQLDRDGKSILASVGLTGNGVAIDPWEGYHYWGTEGRIVYADGEITVAERDAVAYTTEITDDVDFRSLTRRKTQNFIDAIEGRAESRAPGEYGLTVTALTEATYRAADARETVSIEDLVEEHRELIPDS